MATKVRSNKIEKSPPRTQEQRSAETRKKLIDAVVDLITEQGFASVTTLRVADRAGVSRGAMQHHFTTRSDLLLAVVDGIWARMHEPQPPHPTAENSLEAHVDAMVDRYWQSFADFLFSAVIDIWMGSRAEPELFMRINAHLQNVFSESASHWKEYFAEFEIPSERLMLAHEMLRSTIRGLALRRVFGETNNSTITKPEVDAVRGFILATLKGQL